MKNEMHPLHETFADIMGQAKALDSEKAKLLPLVAEELSPVLTGENAGILTDLPSGFGKAAHLVRLTGEMPIYFAKAVALWYAQRGVGAQEIKAVVERECGLHFEREFLQLVYEASAALPALNLDGAGLAKAELMKRAHRLGYQYEIEYRGCAQCTVAAVTDVAGRFAPELFRAANGFAAGMAQMGDGVCGGYSGGMLAMGLFAGRRREFFDGDKDEKDLIGLMGQKLHEKFIETYGTPICHGIHNEIFGRVFRVTIESEKEAFEEAGAHSLDKCGAVVGAAAAWTVEILFDHGFINAEGGGAK